MISVPIAVAVAQWALLLGLGALVFMLYRQLAYLLTLSDARNQPSSGLAVGQPAPEFDYRPWRARSRQRFAPAAAGTLLVFADPQCASCAKAIVALRDAGRRADRAIVVATSATPDQVAASELFATCGLDIVRVDRSVVARRYRVETTPYAFAIDGEGRIRAHGSPLTPRDVAKLLAQAEAPASDAEPAQLTITHHAPTAVAER